MGDVRILQEQIEIGVPLESAAILAGYSFEEIEKLEESDEVRMMMAVADATFISRHLLNVADHSDENPRILSQRGQFTETLSAEIEIEKTVGLCYAEDKKKGLNRIIFVKLHIPDTERETCLHNLNRMNINHATLFPDLIGAAEYCNVKLEITNYS